MGGLKPGKSNSRREDMTAETTDVGMLQIDGIPVKFNWATRPSNLNDESILKIIPLGPFIILSDHYN